MLQRRSIMKVPNVVISTVVAISAAGALGLAYAQSSYSEPQPGTSAPTSQDATPGTMDQSPSGTATQDSSSTMSQDSSSTMDQDSTGSTGTPRSGTYNERVARADRN
jgi:cytoskeletal protein RodZ